LGLVNNCYTCHHNGRERQVNDAHGRRRSPARIHPTVSVVLLPKSNLVEQLEQVNWYRFQGEGFPAERKMTAIEVPKAGYQGAGESSVVC